MLYRKILADGTVAPWFMFWNAESTPGALSISRLTPIPSGIKNKGTIRLKIRQSFMIPMKPSLQKMCLKRFRRSANSVTARPSPAEPVCFPVWYSALTAARSCTTELPTTARPKVHSSTVLCIGSARTSAAHISSVSPF